MITVNVRGRVVVTGEGQVLLFPEEDLLPLRDLAQAVPPEAAWDEDYPLQEHWPWGVSGSGRKMSLIHYPTGQRILLEGDDWASLREALYVGDELLDQVEAARLGGLPRQRIGEAIASGRLFAFRRPGYRRRQWLVPRRALEEFIGARGRKYERRG